MSRRNQPYIPLYVQDFLTDEKLMECSASATGIYIRIMCIMHKSEQYGKIVLKEQYKVNDKIYQSFARYFVRFMPYCIDEIAIGLSELVSTGVLQLEGDVLSQKRMVKDDELSSIRSSSGKIGAYKTNFAAAKSSAKTTAKVSAKPPANTENEIENEIEDESEIETERISVWEKSKAKFLNSKKWKEKFMSIKNITLSELEASMKAYLELLELRNDHRTPKSMYNHFANYYNKIKQNETDKRNNQKPKFGSAIREAGGRMGAIGDTFGKEIA